MTFDQFCDDFRCTIEERRELAYRLASFRMQKTLEALLPIKMKVKK